MNGKLSNVKSAAQVRWSAWLGGVKSWIRPKTDADRWRTIEINMKICIFNVSLSIVCLFVTMVIRMMRHV